MVLTAKFSSFANANLNDMTNKVVGVGGGENVIYPETITWTTSTRPISPYNGLQGFNTTLQVPEFWDAVLVQWVQLATTVSSFQWSEIISSQVAIVDNGYITNNVALINITLPLTADVGDIVKVLGFGAGGWALVANTGQTIQFGDLISSTSGNIASTIYNDFVEVMCVSNSLVWEVMSCRGNITVN
jgi:hypothetical protein